MFGKHSFIVLLFILQGLEEINCLYIHKDQVERRSSTQQNQLFNLMAVFIQTDGSVCFQITHLTLTEQGSGISTVVGLARVAGNMK